MARPKKAPRVRFQVTMNRKTGQALRRYCKHSEQEISSVVERAVDNYLLTDAGSRAVGLMDAAQDPDS